MLTLDIKSIDRAFSLDYPTFIITGNVFLLYI